MSPSLLVSEEHSNKLLLLVVDKKGIFGDSLVKEIDKNITTVLVTAKPFTAENSVIPVPFHKEIPEIPEGNYTHIFFVWDGQRESLHILEPLLQKAASDNAQFIFIMDYHFYKPKLIDYIHQEYFQASIILTGDIFGNLFYESKVTTFFKTSHKEGIISLSDVGLNHLYPCFFPDIIKEILHVGFGGQKKKLFLAFPQHGMTELSVAHAIQKVDPMVKVDFSKEKEEKADLPDGEYLFPSSYPTSQKIQEAYTDYVLDKKDESYKENDKEHFSPKEVEKKQKNIKIKIGFGFIGLILVILLLCSPILLTGIYGLLGGVLLYASESSAKNGNFTNAQQFSQTGEDLFSLARQINVVASQEFNLLFLSSISDKITNKLEVGSLLAKVATDGFAAAEHFSKVNSGKSVSPANDFFEGVNNIKSALVTLENSHLKETIEGVSLEDFSHLLSSYSSIVDSSPVLFGFTQKKTYAILFQNNMELRPGGGFVGSYALVSVDKGRIGNVTIHDVYDADGQLKGHVEPPYIIRRYIQVHWYLRDSNFDVDFSRDAANAAFFIKEETGQSVDGVIGIDLSFVKALLQAAGSVYVPEYKQTVNSDNFFLLTESHVEKNTFAGSSQKKDFLRALFGALQAKLTTTRVVSPKSFFPLLSAIRQKHVVFGFSDPLLQDVFTVSGFSSSLWDGRAVKDNEILDFTGINEANIGINKANAFVNRKVSQNIAFSEGGDVTEKLTITYTNKSKTNEWPGGDYKNYLRVILPNNAKINTVSLNGVTQTIIPAVTDASVYEAPGFIAPAGLEMDSSSENGKQIYGFIVTVPAQKSLQVSITFDLAQKININKSTWTYNGVLFKEPGTDTYPYSLSLTLPKMFAVLEKPKWISSDDNSIFFDKPFSEDTPFEVVFTKK